MSEVLWVKLQWFNDSEIMRIHRKKYIAYLLRYSVIRFRGDFLHMKMHTYGLPHEKDMKLGIFHLYFVVLFHSYNTKKKYTG